MRKSRVSLLTPYIKNEWNSSVREARKKIAPPNAPTPAGFSETRRLDAMSEGRGIKTAGED